MSQYLNVLILLIASAWCIVKTWHYLKQFKGSDPQAAKGLLYLSFWWLMLIGFIVRTWT